MGDRTIATPDRTFLFKAILSIIILTVLLLGGTFFFLAWTMRHIDEGSVARQKAIAQSVVDHVRAEVAHDQESVTVWDEAVEALRATETSDDRDWIDANMGAWMLSYFGHDAAFIVSPKDVLVYSLVQGNNDGAAFYSTALPTIQPMLEALRARLRQGDTTGLSERVLTPGEGDVRLLAGHGAIVSLKPVVSDSGDLAQTAGEEYIHVAVRFLDGTFLDELTDNYGFSGLRFLPQPLTQRDDAGGSAQLPVLSKSGDLVGHFDWQPYRPGLTFLTSIMPVLLAIAGLLIGGVVLLAALLYRRVMAARLQDARIRHIADHDGLTGLLNRTAFERRLDDIMDKAPQPPSLAVLYLDLDRFKQVNDTLGHAAGDAVIKEAARRIQAQLPPGACLCRAGGDEFNAAFSDRDAGQVEDICRKIIEAIEQPIHVEGSQAFIGVSIGVAMAPQDGSRRVELLRKADVALYSAKSGGRGTYALFGAGMDTIVRERAETERDLRLALDDKQQFKVLYQPKYDAPTGAVSSVEALVRWHHPVRGLIGPDVFIPIAEETGLVRELGRFVLEQACRDAVAWPLDHVAVNVSVVQLRDPFFAITVAAILSATGLAARKLELEVTETAWADGSDIGSRNVKALRELGVRIALDDFGTGFSTFGRLQVSEIDHIKIDKVFIDGLGKAHGDEAIVQAIVELARAKGLRTTAEGVENHLQSDFLRRIGCDSLQGFLFSRPVSRDEITLLLKMGGETGDTVRRRSAGRD